MQFTGEIIQAKTETQSWFDSIKKAFKDFQKQRVVGVKILGGKSDSFPNFTLEKQNSFG